MFVTPGPATDGQFRRTSPAHLVADLQDAPARAYSAACKRAVDVALALVMLVVTAPVILLCMLLVRLTSRGPGLYSQTRVGLRGRVYKIHKVRTMYHDCESRSGPRWC